MSVEMFKSLKWMRIPQCHRDVSHQHCNHVSSDKEEKRIPLASRLAGSGNGNCASKQLGVVRSRLFTAGTWSKQELMWLSVVSIAFAVERTARCSLTCQRSISPCIHSASLVANLAIVGDINLGRELSIAKLKTLSLQFQIRLFSFGFRLHTVLKIAT